MLSWLNSWKLWVIILVLIIFVIWIITMFSKLVSWLKRSVTGKKYFNLDQGDLERSDFDHGDLERGKGPKVESYFSEDSFTNKKFKEFMYSDAHSFESESVEDLESRSVEEIDSESVEEIDSESVEEIDSRSSTDISEIKQEMVVKEPNYPQTIKNYLSDVEIIKDYAMSKGEEACKIAIEKIYGVPFFKVRPNWLKNPKTGRNLELDLYNPELKLAVEFNGEQHYKRVPYFHKTEEDYIKQVERDHLKMSICDKLGVYLIIVPYNCPIRYIENYIRYYLPEAVMARRNTQNALR